MTSALTFHLLGPLEVRADGVPIPLGTPKQQIVLALLAVHAGRVVQLDDLVDEVWPDSPPASAIANVRSYAANLRRQLESAQPGRRRLVRHGGGYRLDADTDEVDLLAFLRDSAAGRERLRRGDPGAAATKIAGAVARWRGPMLAGLPRGQRLAARCAAVEGERLEATEELAAAHQAAGEPDRAVALLREHVLANPLRERGHALLMRSLYQTGDVAGALASYAEARTALAEALGIEPGRELRELHTAILNRDPRLDAHPSRSGPPPAPAQLPAAPPGFTGRQDSLKTLDSLLSEDGQPGVVVIAAIGGTAGIGKTALAVHWAHQIADRFPDGQLYVDLRGFGPAGPPLAAAEAMHRFLDALDVPAQRIPSTLDAQAALYRSLLAGKRMLLLLDNARDADQVRPLLPGSPGCVAVITSRNQLAGLAATDGAQLITLDLLSPDEAHQLLARRIGLARLTAEPEATDDIIDRCARLPLALAIVAARAAAHPRFPLSEVAAQLRDTHNRLDALAGDEPLADVRAVFGWSYHALKPDAARLFRLLGLHPGPDITPPAAASLAAVPIARARIVLAELTRSNLLTEHHPGRYTLHDLLRAYATQLTHDIDPDHERHAATGRMLDHYLHTAYVAARQLNPHRDPITLSPPLAGTTPEHLADHAQAIAWFTAEHPVLATTVAHAAATGWDRHTWQLAWALDEFLGRAGHWHDWTTVLTTAVAAASRDGHPGARALTHRLLGYAHHRMGAQEAAHAHTQTALELYEQAGDQAGQADVHHNIAQIWEGQGRHAEALHHCRQALTLYRAAAHRRGQAHALNAVGWCLSLLGQHEQALTHCRQALTLMEELGDRYGQAHTWDSLGYAYHHLGHHSRAITCYQHAIDMLRDLGDRYYEADTLTHLGDTYHAAGNPDTARVAWQQALTILKDLDHPDADEVRAKLLGVGAG